MNSFVAVVKRKAAGQKWGGSIYAFISVYDRKTAIENNVKMNFLIKKINSSLRRYSIFQLSRSLRLNVFVP